MRLDPDLLGRYLALLLPLILLMMVVEPLLPESALRVAAPCSASRSPRQGGLHRRAELQRHAVRRGRHDPRPALARAASASSPFLAALPSLSRGLIAAVVSWLGAKAIGRRVVWLAPVAVLILCAQPLIVLAVDASIDQDAAASS